MIKIQICLQLARVKLARTLDHTVYTALLYSHKNKPQTGSHKSGVHTTTQLATGLYRMWLLFFHELAKNGSKKHEINLVWPK